MFGPLPRHERGVPVPTVEVGHVAGDAVVELPLAGLELVRRDLLVAAEVGDGPEVRCELPGESDQLEIALRRPLDSRRR